MSSIWNPFREDLIYFQLLCEEKNLSRTADRLGVSQPQVSKTIKKFEDLYGQLLFVRRAHGVELTQAGEDLAKEIEQLRTRWRQYQLNSDVDEGLRGQFSLGINSSIAMSFYPEKIHELLAEHPELDIRTYFLPSLQVTQKVNDLQFDLGVVAGPIRSPDLVVKKVRTDHVALWKKSGSSDPKVIYYNPEMIHVHRLLKKFSGKRLRALNDYQVISEICVQNSDAAGLIPSNIAELKGLSRFGERLFEVPVNLIVHREKLKAKPIKILFSELLKS